MKKISILGGCASQLIAEKIPHVKAAGMTNWLSIASPPIKDCENVSDEFIDGLDLSNYFKRIMRLDLRKELLNYITEGQADYLLINCNDCRLNVIVEDDVIEKDERLKCLTYRDGLEEQYDKMLSLLRPFHKYKIKSCYDIDLHYYKMAVDYVCSRVREFYTDDKIILHQPNYADGYVDDKGYHRFHREKDTENVRTEEIVSFVIKVIKENFPNCHVINFPDNVLGDSKHSLGIHPLHYHPLYYEYGNRVLKIIFKNNPDEKSLLEQLRKQYSEKFRLERERLLLPSKINSIERKQNLLIDILINVNENLSADLLKKIDDFSLYLDMLYKVQKKYIVALAVKDTPGLYRDNIILNKLRKLGFNRYPNQLWKMYAGVVWGGITFYDCTADIEKEPVIFDMKTSEVSIHLESHSYCMENKSSIRINDVEYSLNNRGINLVVYDTAKKELMDSISFDSHVMDFFCR